MAARRIHLPNENADFQRLDALRSNRNLRHRLRLFPVEGVRQLETALSGGWPIKGLVLPSDRRLSDWARSIVDASAADTHYTLPAALHAKLSNKREASEIVALVEIPEDDIGRITLGTPPLVVVFDRPNYPGNLGTLVRSCDALGADGLIVTGHSADPYDPQAVAASTGSLFALPVVRLRSARDLEPLLTRIREEYGDLQVVGTSARAAKLVYECNFWRPTLLLVGNETDGLSHAYADMADETIAIPMTGSASSLNVACAATLVLYEAARQRRG
ncbi:MAG TPA: TrmH family RNA methyltransferase [Trueperaceae bacterium]